MAADNFLTNIVLDAAMMPEMSPREKALRDIFVQEYLYDRDPYAAALRCGFMRSFAAEYAAKFMEEPYVQQQIRLFEEVEHSDEKVQEKSNQKRIMAAMFREAFDRGPGSKHAARVAALKTLGEWNGLGAQHKPAAQTPLAPRGGVMVVPAIADVNEWEEVAQRTQEKLVEDARS